MHRLIDRILKTKGMKFDTKAINRRCSGEFVVPRRYAIIRRAIGGLFTSVTLLDTLVVTQEQTECRRAACPHDLSFELIQHQTLGIVRGW